MFPIQSVLGKFCQTLINLQGIYILPAGSIQLDDHLGFRPPGDRSGKILLTETCLGECPLLLLLLSGLPHHLAGVDMGPGWPLWDAPIGIREPWLESRRQRGHLAKDQSCPLSL